MKINETEARKSWLGMCKVYATQLFPVAIHPSVCSQTGYYLIQVFHRLSNCKAASEAAGSMLCLREFCQDLTIETSPSIGYLFLKLSEGNCKNVSKFLIAECSMLEISREIISWPDREAISTLKLSPFWPNSSVSVPFRLLGQLLKKK